MSIYTIWRVKTTKSGGLQVDYAPSQSHFEPCSPRYGVCSQNVQILGLFRAFWGSFSELKVINGLVDTRKSS